MFKRFLVRRTLAAHTPLSHFVLSATSAEKKRIYNKALQQAAEEQRAVIERVLKSNSEKSGAAA